MTWALDVTLKSRKYVYGLLENLSLEQLNKVPEGFNNNIIWNVAHTIVTQQLLVYRLSGLPCMVPEDMIARYRKGTKAEGDVTQAEVDAIKNLMFSTIEKTAEDYDNEVFQTYNEYTVTTKNTLTNVDDAIDFNNFHEGIHLGYILALQRVI
ncbi:DinB family protein [Winogradskyella maritima]|uniref:DinB family protein n=1 Tax=Winogradskyella maritima TaxID=1517766 RepID=A0ABV8AD81_9FLAO|nr:DinB family protein [Winogradskyella maritima]